MLVSFVFMNAAYFVSLTGQSHWTSKPGNHAYELIGPR